MNKQILVTDDVFIFPEHEQQMANQGFTVHRFKGNATEAELCDVVRGKHGYILGGIEHITPMVIDAADVLEAISFTGSGYTEYIPGHEEATRRGIAVSAATGGNAIDVAEFTIGTIFEMVRNLPLLQTPGGKGYYTARRIQGLTLGIIGYGHIGRQVANLAQHIGMRVLVTARQRPANLPSDVEYTEIRDLLSRSNIVSVHVNKEHGLNVLGKEELALMQDGAILINNAFADAVNANALYAEINSHRLRAAFDQSPSLEEFPSLELGSFVRSNAQTAWNTQEANQQISDRVTNTIINLLTTGDDPDLKNPSYKNNRVVA